MLTTTEIIARKRDGFEHSDAEIHHIVTSIVHGHWTDYQAAAWLMAVTIRGMTTRETMVLTTAMARSGETIPVGGDKPRLDKHSTGGVGDKTSLIVLPLLAAMGANILKMSGRGLGFTGGTLDKLESIPGFRTEYTPTEAMELSSRTKLAIIGQSATLVPADRILYALRDVTATVASKPLIVSSILSKKIAAGAKSLILDVKTGRASFNGPPESARELALEMISVASEVGIAARAVVSNMNVPLGRTIGNALELKEAIAVLKNPDGADARLLELCLTLAAHGAVVAGIANEVEIAWKVAEQKLFDGSAARIFREMITGQGGDGSVVEHPEDLPTAPQIEIVPSNRSGTISDIDARGLGEVAMHLGAGRVRKGAEIDPAVGIVLRCSVGERISPGQPIAEIHTAKTDAGIIERVKNAFSFSQSVINRKPVVLETITEVDRRE